MATPTQDPAIQEGVTDVAGAAPGIVSDVKAQNYTGVATAAEKLYERISPLVPVITKEAKAGYKTTEFYVFLVWEALTQLEAIHMPGTWGKLVAGLGGVLGYVLSRGIAKNGVGNQVPVS